MQPKLDFLGPQAASAFQDASVATAYQYRPAYPAQAFEILSTLIVDRPRQVLDAGSGSGPISRHLVEHVDRVDAVDIALVCFDESAHKLCLCASHSRWTPMLNRSMPAPASRGSACPFVIRKPSIARCEHWFPYTARKPSNSRS